MIFIIVIKGSFCLSDLPAIKTIIVDTTLCIDTKNKTMAKSLCI